LLRNPACPDGLGNLRECEILVAGANASSPADSGVLVGTNYWTGPVEFGAWNFTSWDVNKNDPSTSGTYIAGLWVGQTSNALIVSMDLNNRNDATFKMSKILIVPKADLYPATSGQNIPLSWFTNLQNSNGTPAFTIVPAQTYMENSATYLVNSYDAGTGTAKQLTLWGIDTTSLSQSKLAKSTLSVASFSSPPNAEQQGTNLQISTWDARIASVASPQTNALWVTHVTGCVPLPDTVQRSCIRWYEIDPVAKKVSQQNTVGAQGTHFYYPAVAANANGAMTLVFSASSTNSDVGVYFMGRRPTDPLSHLTGVYYLLQPGLVCYSRPAPGGTYSGGNYVGARSAVALDASDNTSFWITGAFTGGPDGNCSANGWGTWLGRLTW
jgi:hypothetical protein